jgi:hypothetical protein
MTKVLFHIAVISILCASSVWAQNNSTDGIVIDPSSVNEKTFYYGEPAHIYFRITNTKSSTNYYYKPVRFVNVSFSMRSVSTGKKLTERNRLGGHALSVLTDTQMKKVPDQNQAFKPGETVHYDLFVNDEFGTERLSNESYTSRLNEELRTLPVGNYEVTMDYLVLPANIKLTATYRFRIAALPAEEQEAFNRYVNSTSYAAKNHVKGDNNYSKDHPSSYENFLKDYPNSIFSNHAFINMVDQVYGYMSSTPLQKEMFKKYLAFYSDIRNNSIKMGFIKYVPEFINTIDKANAKSELDKYLKKIEQENWELSNRLIRFSETNLKIGGLVNYAKEAQDRR